MVRGVRFPKYFLLASLKLIKIMKSVFGQFYHESKMGKSGTKTDEVIEKK